MADPTEISSHDLTAWLLSADERGNDRTRLDEIHPGQAWTEGNRVRPLIHGATYFARLHECLEATGAGDVVRFADWQGDADERLTGEPGSEVLEVLGRAAARGVDVRGLVWHSRPAAAAGDLGDNAEFSSRLRARGVEAWLDLRTRPRGSHHQKFVVLRHRDDPSRDVAFVGGIDLCHSRRDDAEHLGDPQHYDLAEEYGATPPWHDVQAEITGPAVHDVETVFRERWEDPAPFDGTSGRRITRPRRSTPSTPTPSPLPAQLPAPPAVPGGTHVVQLLRTYPQLTAKRDYPFAPGGERSVARGYTRAIRRARRLIYVEDQYLWGRHVGEMFGRALEQNPELHIIAVTPLHPDLEGPLGRWPQLEGRRRALRHLLRAAPDRVALYGLENHSGTPVYVHAKACVIDDTWTTIGSDNFNRRSWTHDSELSAVVVDRAGDYGRRLRLTLAAEHLDRVCDESFTTTADCLDPADMFATYAASAARLDAWHDGGRVGPRPDGRLRAMRAGELGPFARAVAALPYTYLHDPDGRPRHLRRDHGFWEENRS
ncbi:phospholipase D family protein [Nocardioides sp.]|uniref:phospholipase D family protein n=1 Tax=Nocardioides sp. TaxID=35761 RepID=UPI002B268DA0|nr:phospholipase D-like domain-containing protein [Nocardioides sp.]